MKRSLVIATAALLLIVTGCAAGETDAGETSDTTAPDTTVATDDSPTTTLVAENTSTTTLADTTTTTEPADTPKGGLTDAEALLASLEPMGDVVSGRMEGSIAITGLPDDGSGLSELTMVFSTAFDARTGNSSFLMDMSSLEDAVDADSDDPFASLAAGLLGEMEFRQVDDRMYTRSGFFNVMFGTDAEWVSMPAEEGQEFSTGFETAPTDPNDVLDAYDGAAAVVENLGQESVNGTTATHYQITFDTTTWLEELSADERAELEESGVLASGQLPIELWITDDGYLVRMIMEIDGTNATSADEQFDTMRLRYDMYDINGQVTIEAPPASQVVDVEDLELEGFDFDLDFDA